MESNAGRAEALRRACPDNVRVQLLDAGHCPHDEAPAAVNAGLLEFLEPITLGVDKGPSAEALLAT